MIDPNVHGYIQHSYGGKIITKGDESKKTETIDVSLDGKNPTFIYGSRLTLQGSVKIEDTWLLRVPPINDKNFVTQLFLHCKRLNTVKSADKNCKSYYLVNGKNK